jgi:TadE-like protein
MALKQMLMRSPLGLARGGGERGTAITEFALVLPWLLLLLLAMIDFGKAMNYWIDETHLANEGARWAVVNKNPGTGSGVSLQQYILDQVETGEEHGDTPGTQPTPTPGAHPAQVCISFPNTTSNVGDPVRVEVTYDYYWLRYLTSSNYGGLGPHTQIGGSATMRLEAKPTTFSAGCTS